MAMYYIVGLGNPGSEYENTRHNMGRLAVLALAKDLGFAESDFKYDKVLDSLKLKVDIDGESAILILPNTFMNKSGKAIAPLLLGSAGSSSPKSALVKAVEKKAAKLIVIHDDLEIKESNQFSVQSKQKNLCALK
jgi:peptidyl-tRNA hydrolase